MPAQIRQPDPDVSLTQQLAGQDAPVILINVFTVPAEVDEAFHKVISKNLAFAGQQPGFVSSQLHKGIGGSTTYVNYNIWEDVQCFRAAFSNPEFQKGVAQYPDGVVTAPHLFQTCGPAISFGN